MIKRSLPREPAAELGSFGGSAIETVTFARETSLLKSWLGECYMETQRQKIECHIAATDRLIPATADLIEIRYSDRLVFWNAVILLTNDDFNSLIAGRNSLDIVVVHLPDGRTGGLHIVYGIAASEGYREIAGVGKPN